MKDLTSTSFGYVIAFLLPGVFGSYALTYWSPAAGVLLQPLLKADTNVGPSAVFLLVCVGMGLLLAAVRYFVFESLLCHNHKLPQDMFAKLVEENRLSSFQAVVDQHYRYHQFYGGCAIAALLMFTGWMHSHWELSCRLLILTLGFLLFELLVVSAGRQTYIQFVKRGTIVVQGKEQSETGDN